MEPLVYLLGYKHHEEIQLGAAKALSILATSAENNRLEIVDAGAVQSIKKLVMKVYESVQIEMITCLRNLSSSGMDLPFNSGHLTSFSPR